MRDQETPRSHRAWAFRKLPPSLPDPTEPRLPPELKARREAARKEEQKRKAAEAHFGVLRADRAKWAWIEDGNDLRQPSEYRGVVFEHADNSGVHPSPFPPYRDDPQGSLTDAFIDFQNYHRSPPEYYCVDCRIRFNARAGGRCGPCIGKDLPTEYPL